MSTIRSMLSSLACLRRLAVFGFGFATAVAAQTGTPTVSVGNASIAEGDSGTRLLNIPLTRTGASTESIAVQYQTNASPSNPATAGTDYVSITSGNALLPAGSNTLNLPVTINGDTTQEPDENFLLHVTSATNVGPALSFAANASFPADSDEVVFGDINNDGRPDLIATISSGAVDVSLSTSPPGATTLSFLPAVRFATSSSEQTEVALTDVNGDGRLDLAVSSGLIAGGVSILLNTTVPGNSTPAFASSVFFPALGDNSRPVEFADFNGDGRADMVVGNVSSATLEVRLNTTAPGASAPSFAAPVSFTAGNAYALALGDLNGDGRPDIAAASQFGDGVNLLLNTTLPGATTPTFGTTSFLATGDFASGVAMADINGDGRPDLAVANANSGTVSLLINQTAPGASAPLFAATLLTGIVNPRGIRLTDVNGDGRPDLLAASVITNTVAIRLNATAPGASVPNFVGSFSRAVGNFPEFVNTADLNGDGLPDLVVNNSSGTGTAFVLLNTTVPPAPAPAFGSAVSVGTGALIGGNGAGPLAIVRSDFNGDGRIDLATANNAASSVSVVLNQTPTGAALPVAGNTATFATFSQPQSIASGDLNNDGRPDLVTADNSSAGSSGLSVLLNTTSPGAADASFAAATSMVLGSRLRTVVLGDFNGDGRLDLAVTNNEFNLGVRGVYVLLNQTVAGSTLPQFAPAVLLSGTSHGVGASPVGLAVADLDNDGRLDLVASNALGNSLSVLRNATQPGAASPGFAAAANLPVGVGPQAVTAGDVNGDGRADLIASNGTANTLSVLLNATQPGDLSPSFAAQQVFPGPNSPQTLVFGDVNGDGRPDLVVAESGSAGAAAAVLINQTGVGASLPAFAPQVRFTGPSGQVLGLLLADHNGDGRNDLVLANFGNSSVQVLLNGLYPVAIATNEAQGTILDDDSPPNLTINDVSLAEGNSGTTAFTFTVSLSAPARAGGVSMSLSTSDGTATTADNDYVARSLSGQTIPAGSSTYTFTVTVNGDTRVETNESFFVNISNVTGATVLDNQGQGNITNDDAIDITPNAFSFIGQSNVALNTLRTSAPVTITGINSPAPFSVTGGFAGLDGGPCTMTSGNVSLNQQLRLCHSSSASFNTDTNTTLTIGADGVLAGVSDTFTSRTEAAPSLSITPASPSVTEGNGGLQNLTLTVQLASAAATPVTVNYATADGTATTADGDYTASSGTLSFAPGETSKTLTVTVNGDLRVEPSESFTVQLSGATPAGVGISGGTSTITITNDDAASLSINDVTLAEGNSGTTNFVFTVALSNPSALTVRANYATSNGSATTADNDYLLTAGSVEFSPGETSKTVTVQVVGDTRVEPNETFTVVLSNPEEATISDASGLGTITNDDAASLSINDVTLAEGNSGTTAFTFSVALSNASATTVTVNFATANGTATTADGDYAANSGTLSFAAGETSKTVTVQVTGDTKVEPNESFTVGLSAAVGATISDASGLGTISNDDATTLEFDDVSFDEGNSGNTPFVFTVTLSAPSASTVTVDYATSDSRAIAGSDYITGSGTLSFAPGETSKTFAVQVIGDLVAENDESFLVTLGNPVGAQLGGFVRTGTIIDDDAASLSINDVTLAEGNSGSTDFTFTVALSNASASIVRVNYSVPFGTATANDFAFGATSGQLTFNPGVTSQTVTVGVRGDLDVEPDETFSVGLFDALGATISDASGLGTITNDDATTLSIDDVALSEGNAGSTAFTFTVALSNASASTVTVNYATANGTATTADSDYIANSGTLSFAPGETRKSLSVQVIGDLRFEADDTFSVILFGASGASIGKISGLGTIGNDDNLDTTPEAFSFGSIANVAPSTLQTSAAVPINGLEAAAVVSVDIGEVSINGGPFGRGGSVGPGQTVQVRHISSASFGGTVTSTVTIGGVQGTFTSTTTAAPVVDVTPDAFGFVSEALISTNSRRTSKAIVITGYAAPTMISVSAGSQYSIGCRTNFTDAPGMISPGQSVCVRHMSSPDLGKTVTTTLTVGGIDGTYSTTTNPPDTRPNNFSFPTTSGVAVNSVNTSAPITVGGINTASPISVSAGSFYSIGSGPFVDTPGMVLNGQQVRVRTTASSRRNISAVATLTIGGVNGLYRVTTAK